MGLIEVKNPHSVLAVLEKRPEAIEELCLSRDPGEGWDQVKRHALSQGIKIKESSQKPGKGPKDGRALRNFARVQERQPLPFEKVLENPENGLWLVLDCLQDPHNVGALFRLAAFFGVKGMILSEERSAPISGTVYDVASGGVDWVPFAVETNIARVLDEAKEREFWVLGTSEHAQKSFKELSLDRPWLLVLGNEERGMRRLTREKCDETCTIPSAGTGVGSLNVSVAGGILVSHFLSN